MLSMSNYMHLLRGRKTKLIKLKMIMSLRRMHKSAHSNQSYRQILLERLLLITTNQFSKINQFKSRLKDLTKEEKKKRE
jgi:hypothetical protein